MTGATPLELRASRHGALGDPIRLAIVEALGCCDRSPAELGGRLGLGSNLLAHHLDVLEAAGLLVERFDALKLLPQYEPVIAKFDAQGAVLRVVE